MPKRKETEYTFFIFILYKYVYIRNLYYLDMIPPHQIPSAVLTAQYRLAFSESF